MSENTTTHTLFKSSLQSMQYVFKDGSMAHFINGRYYTPIIKRQEELQAEVDNGGCGGYVYVDPDEPTFDTNAATPVDALRAKILEELLASGYVVKPTEEAATSTGTEDAPAQAPAPEDAQQLQGNLTSQVAGADGGSVGLGSVSTGGPDLSGLASLIASQSNS
jgi:hypothetical protein